MNGVTVVDFTRFVSGSYAAMLMASLGAEVIKIERLPDGDPYRKTGSRSGESSALFNCLNSGKRSVAINFDDPLDRDLLDRLVERADVFVENARPGSLEHHGLDHQTLCARFPKLVYASISAFGDAGPSRTRGGFDLVLQAESGVMSVTGDPSSGPSKIGLPMLDIGAGVSCLAVVLAALREREQSGTGTHVSTSLFEFGLAGFLTQADSIVRDGKVPGLLGSHSPSFAPYGYFQCADRGIIIAGSGAEELWQRLCVVLDAEDLISDERFASNAERLAHRDELTRCIDDSLASARAEVWLARFESAGIPAGEVRTADEALLSEQAQALGLLYELGAGTDAYWNIAAPFRDESGPLVAPGPAPELGADNHEMRQNSVGHLDQ